MYPHGDNIRQHTICSCSTVLESACAINCHKSKGVLLTSNHSSCGWNGLDKWRPSTVRQRQTTHTLTPKRVQYIFRNAHSQANKVDVAPQLIRDDGEMWWLYWKWSGRDRNRCNVYWNHSSLKVSLYTVGVLFFMNIEFVVYFRSIDNLWLLGQENNVTKSMSFLEYYCFFFYFPVCRLSSTS